MKSYTAEKAFLAFDLLGRSELPPAERLANAWVNHLHHAQVHETSDDVKEVLAKLSEFFQRVPNKELGSAVASARQFDAEDIGKVSELMASLIFRALDEERKL